MAWRLAKSIVTLRDEVNARWPDRNKASDGTIGDAAHATRTSDHNPFVTVNGIGVVRAFDITHDPSGGPSGDLLARHFAQMMEDGDQRLRYVIWNRRIYNPAISMSWRTYTGSNPHDRHIHVSVSLSRSRFDRTGPWGLLTANLDEEDDMLRMNQRGDGAAIGAQVAANQALLAVNKWRRARGLEAHPHAYLKKDDVAGPETHGRINWLLDLVYDNRVSRVNQKVVTPAGLSLLGAIPAKLHEDTYHREDAE